MMKRDDKSLFLWHNNHTVPTVSHPQPQPSSSPPFPHDDDDDDRAAASELQVAAQSPETECDDKGNNNASSWNSDRSTSFGIVPARVNNSDIVAPDSNGDDDNGDDDVDDDDDDMWNDILKVRSKHATLQLQQQQSITSTSNGGRDQKQRHRVYNSTESTTTASGYQPELVSSLPGSYAIAGINNRQHHRHTRAWEARQFDGNGSASSTTICEEDLNNNHSNAPTAEVAPVIIAADKYETERERIFQEAMDTVAKNATIANVIWVEADAGEDMAQHVNETSDSSLDVKEQTLKAQRQCPPRNRTLIAVAIVATLTLLIVLGSTLYAQRNRRKVTQTPSNNTGGTFDQTNMSAGSSSPINESFPNDGAFYTTQQLYDAVDAYLLALNTTSSTPPETSSVALQYGYPMNKWNVSRITNFTRVFDPERNSLPLDSTRYPPNITIPFNEDLRSWDMSNAVTLYGMFANALHFVGNGIEYWDISNVQDISYMFLNAVSFTNANISRWNTSRVTRMEGVFCYAAKFDGDISSWDISSVKSMYEMFIGTEQYTGINLELWDVSNVQNMDSLFQKAIAFRGNISNWNTSRVTSMRHMFWEAQSFNIDLSSWSVGKVTDMMNMFATPSFAGDWDLSHWDTSRVTNMAGIFSGAELFNGNVSTWDVSNVQDMSEAFLDCRSFNGDISQWNTSRVASMKSMFSGAKSFNADLSSWSVGNVVDMTYMLATPSFAGGWDLSNWDTSRVVSMVGIFSGAEWFNGNLSTWDVSNVQDMSEAFSGCTNFNGDLSNWDTSRVGNMALMFHNAEMFSGDLSLWDTSKVAAMHDMFLGATSFNSDISRWNVSNVTVASRMFLGASSFNQSLCEWQSTLPQDCDVSQMFESSGCVHQEDPIVAADDTGKNQNFCTQCHYLN